MTDEQEKAINAYEKARAKVHRCPTGKPAFTVEGRYRQTYQRLVKLGVAPQLRLKYR